MEKRIIDQRKKEKFMVDDEYLNGMARKAGWQATLIYVTLCRHVDKSQECFPSIKKMMDKLGVSRNTVLKGIKNLEARNVIRVKKTRTEGGKWLNNKYILIDKSEWQYGQLPDRDMDK